MGGTQNNSGSEHKKGPLANKGGLGSIITSLTSPEELKALGSQIDKIVEEMAKGAGSEFLERKPLVDDYGKPVIDANGRQVYERHYRPPY